VSRRRAQHGRPTSWRAEPSSQTGNYQLPLSILTIYLFHLQPTQLTDSSTRHGPKQQRKENSDRKTHLQVSGVIKLVLSRALRQRGEW